MSLFVDTSVWYAAADTSDASNARACEILSEGGRLVTTDHILVESWVLLRYRSTTTSRSTGSGPGARVRSRWSGRAPDHAPVGHPAAALGPMTRR